MAIVLLKADDMPKLEDGENWVAAWLVVVAAKPGPRMHQVAMAGKLCKAEIMVIEDTWEDFNHNWLHGEGI